MINLITHLGWFVWKQLLTHMRLHEWSNFLARLTSFFPFIICIWSVFVLSSVSYLLVHFFCNSPGGGLTVLSPQKPALPHFLTTNSLFYLQLALKRWIIANKSCSDHCIIHFEALSAVTHTGVVSFSMSANLSMYIIFYVFEKISALFTGIKTDMVLM